MLALRKGADAIPHSWFVFLLAIGMLVISSLSAMLLIDSSRDQDHVLTYAGYALGLFFYGSVLFLAGFASRMLQTISAIVACGALITFLYVAEYIVFQSLFGSEFASLVGILIIFWSVPVEGHIIAKAIEQHWFVGITIAIVALVLQIGFQSVFAGSG